MPAPSVGAAAPQFNLTDQHGAPRRLSEFAGRPVLVYFYPRAQTPGCTQQACGLRDIAADVGDTVVIGISPDSPAKLAAFDAKHQLGFVLLSDPDHAVAESYGAWGLKKLYGKESFGVIRSAVLIDERGIVESAWPKISPKDTPAALLAALEARA